MRSFRFSTPAAGSGLVDSLTLWPAAERLVELYLDIADQAGEEATVDRAQSLAARAIARLAWLRSLA